MIIQIRSSVHGIYDKQNNIGFLYCNSYLLVDLFLKNIIRIYNPTAGIYNRKFLPTPFDLTVLPVSCRSGNFIYNCFSRLCQTVEQSRLPYIRTPDYSHYISHNSSIYFIRLTDFPSGWSEIRINRVDTRNSSIYFLYYASLSPPLRIIRDILSFQKKPRYLFLPKFQPFSMHCLPFL